MLDWSAAHNPNFVEFIMQIAQWAGELHVKKQGNSVTRDLPPTGSEANTTSHIHLGIPIYIPI